MKAWWNYVARIVETLASILIGLGITFRHLVSKPVTLQYPDERWEPPYTFRGMPALLSDEDGALKCTACRSCTRICPASAIQIKAELTTGEGGRKRLVLQEYVVDLGRCIVCGLCAEVCPNEALTMASEYELATVDPANLTAGLDRLAEVGRKYRYNNQQVLPEGYGEGHVVREGSGVK